MPFPQIHHAILDFHQSKENTSIKTYMFVLLILTNYNLPETYSISRFWKAQL
jgi:hypothetical protein